ncbi:MAG: T9SS type A sorting domain-containing protein, partial [Bacteroidetes bacterium]|nr:T9SS type A sorting domain-containing protein [Bacteroidota bacterium]
ARFKLNSGLKNTRKAKLGMVIEGIDEKELNLTTKISGGDGSLPKENINEITLENVNVVEEYNLVQNYPNPFNPSTIIKYQLPADGIVTLKVYDILGKEIKTLVNRKQSSGVYEVVFDASEYASGVYVYRLDILSTKKSKPGNFTSVKKMLLVK